MLYPTQPGDTLHTLPPHRAWGDADQHWRIVCEPSHQPCGAALAGPVPAQTGQWRNRRCASPSARWMRRPFRREMGIAAPESSMPMWVGNGDHRGYRAIGMPHP